MAEHWPRQADGQPRLSHVKTFALGAASRATAAFVFCPITVVKTRMVQIMCSSTDRTHTLSLILVCRSMQP